MPLAFEGEPNYSGGSSSILDAEVGEIRSVPRDETGSDGATLAEPAILISDRKISSLTDLLPILETPPQQVT